ncbi:MAG: SCP2 sterol-binding domain-containing protein [Methylobacter tundripaludum]|uniref:Ubiquinone biosynthesis accessory factor UbiJ n=1 Tax=Methylobacter tundripaludum TaxID=173365 RepID=A0A2S6H7P7_9GAMM|nr:SCP2 sterol-binding domain-containing protein [Methylobacter tundripaludum]MCK9636367.1 SCP2 sterol-binding domain-containing protein [Methylobacter tundripaludum]PPK73497.1 ubiquinone biosynthesis protein UbiJ [Methylobacter tundripaludum]
MTIKPLLIGALEATLNQYLSLDQDSGYFLTPLAGKVIAVNIQPFDETVYLCPTTDSIQCLDQFPDPPDTRLTGSIWALGLMGLSSTPMRSVFSGEVKIEGDMQTGRKFQELFAKLDIDLEEKLSQFTGDIIAHKTANFFRAGQNWSKDSLETFRLNAKEFLQEETRDLPAAPEADIFYAQVDELRTDFDRLQSRIDRLKSTLQNKS